MSNLDALLALMASKGDNTPAILPEAAVMRLREAAAIQANPPRFAVGDLVTPRMGMNVRGHGEPHIVVEVNHEASPVFTGNCRGDSYGNRPQCRIMSIMQGEVACHWLEAYRLEPYTAAE